MSKRMNRLRTNASNALRQSFTMNKNNATDGNESNESEIESGLVPDEVVVGDVIGMVAVVEDTPREQLFESDPEEVKTLATEIATSLSAEGAEAAMADPRFEPEVSAVEDATDDDGMGTPATTTGACTRTVARPTRAARRRPTTRASPGASIGPITTRRPRMVRTCRVGR